MSLDCKQFDKWLAKLKSKNISSWYDAREKITNNLAQRALALAQQSTPVGHYPHTGKVGGTLKRSWAIQAGSKTASSYQVEIFNNIKYAPYVEYGHRTRNHRGWVPGKFMLTNAESTLGSIAGNIVQESLGPFVRDLLE